MSKNAFLMIAAAFAVFWFLNRGKSNTVLNLGDAINGVREIFSGAKIGDPAYGWRFFDNGVSISPSGTYYKDGQIIWVK